MMTIVFFGSDELAVVQLKNLLASRHKVLACVTQPDMPKGRHYALTATAVKQFAQDNHVAVLQPATLGDKDFRKEISALNADLFVVAAFGQIFPDELLKAPKMFTVNVHTSLLPKYRGAAPINWAVVNGEKKTGVTIFKVERKVDSGPIIAQQSIAIGDNDTAVTLKEKLSQLGAGLLVDAIDKIEAKSYKLAAQREDKATYAPKLKKEDGKIHWEKSAQEIHNLARGLLPWPGAFCFYNGKRVKVVATEVVPQPLPKAAAGTVGGITKTGIVVATSKGGLLLTRLHPESSKEMGASEFVSGHGIGIGSAFE